MDSPFAYGPAIVPDCGPQRKWVAALFCQFSSRPAVLPWDHRQDRRRIPVLCIAAGIFLHHGDSLVPEGSQARRRLPGCIRAYFTQCKRTRKRNPEPPVPRKGQAALLSLWSGTTRSQFSGGLGLLRLYLPPSPAPLVSICFICIGNRAKASSIFCKVASLVRTSSIRLRSDTVSRKPPTCLLAAA